MAAGVLDVFATVLGLCLTTTLGPDMVDKHCFSPVYAGAHVRDLHVVTAKGKPVYEGETIYSATPEGIVFTYVNSSGGAGTGTGTVKDGVMTFSMTMRAMPRARSSPIAGPGSRCLAGTNNTPMAKNCAASPPPADKSSRAL